MSAPSLAALGCQSSSKWVHMLIAAIGTVTSPMSRWHHMQDGLDHKNVELSQHILNFMNIAIISTSEMDCFMFNSVTENVSTAGPTHYVGV